MTASFFSFAVSAYAQLGVRDTTGMDIVYFYSSGWCANVNIYASSGNVYANVGEFCVAATLSRVAGDSLMLSGAESCAATPLSFANGANPDSVYFSLGEACGNITLFSHNDTARILLSASCFSGRLRPEADEHCLHPVDTLCAATSMSEAGDQNPDSIMVSGGGFCAPAAIFMGNSGVETYMGGSCFGAFMQDTGSRFNVFSQACAATPLSLAGSSNPDSIMVKGESGCAAAQIFTASNNVFMNAGSSCSGGRFSHTKIDSTSAFMACALVRIPLTMDMMVIGARFDGREWGFKKVPNNLIWLCSDKDAVTLQAHAALPSTFSWFDKNRPGVRLSSADTLHLSAPVKEGDYYAMRYGYGNNVSDVIAVRRCNCSFVKTSHGDTTIYAYTDANIHVAPRISGGSADLRSNHYQWFMDGVPHNTPNATGMLTMNTGARAGVHKLVVRAISPCDTLYGDTITLVLCAPVSKVDKFTAHGMTDVNLLPDGKTLDACLNTDFELRASIRGATLYRWYKNGVEVASGGDSVYKVSVSLQRSDSGYYRVTGYSLCGDSASASVKVNVEGWLKVKQPLPQALSICEGTPLTLRFMAENARTYYLYKTSADSANVIAQHSAQADSIFSIPRADTLQSGRYIVEARNACSSLYDTIYISVHARPHVKLKHGDLLACPGNSLLLTAEASGYDSITWRLNGRRIATGTLSINIPSATLADAGRYVVEVYNRNGCRSDSAVAYVGIRSMLVPDITFPNDALYSCEGAPLTLTFAVKNATAYRWTRNGVALPCDAHTLTIGSLLQDSAGVYEAVAYHLCDTLRDSVVVMLYPRVRFTKRPAARVFVCEGDSLALKVSADNADSIAWFHNGRQAGAGNTGGKPHATLADSGLYTAVAYGSCGNDTATAFVEVGRGQLSVASPLPGDTLRLCEGEQLRLRYSSRGAVGCSWHRNGALLQSGLADTLLRINAVTVSEAGRYVVSSYSGCDTLRDTIDVIINAASNITLQPADTSVCNGGTATRTFVADNATSCAWYTLSGMQVSASATLSVTAGDIFYGGRYYGIATNACRTAYTDTIEVHVGSAIRLASGLPDTLTLCEGDTLTLSLAADNLFRSRWVHNGNTLSLTDSVYHVANVRLSDTGLYIVAGYNGCDAISDTAYVVVNALPRFTVQPRDTSLCGAGTATLTAHADNVKGIEWYKVGVNASNSSYSTLLTATAGYYYTLAQNACGTVSSDTVEVRVFVTAPAQTLTLSDTAICEGTSLQLSADGSDVFRYVWRRDNDTLATTTNGSYTITAATLADAGRYYVTGYSACGSFTDTATVDITSGVSVQRVSRDTFLCAGESYTLSVQATNYDSIAWIFGGKKISASSSYHVSNVNDLTSGIYRYEIYGHGACGGYPVSDSVRVLSHTAPPVLTRPMPDVSLCSGNALALGAGIDNACAYLWYHSNMLQATTDSLFYKPAASPSHSGIYMVEAINGCGSISAAARVTVTPIAQAAANYAAQSLCIGDSLSLRAITTHADTFYWELNGQRLSDNAKTLLRQSVTAADTGIYTFIAVNKCNSDTVKVAHVSVNDILQQREFMQDTLALCESGALELSVSVGNADGYRWFRNGVKIAGASDSAYSVASVTSSDAGLLVVQAYNACTTLYDTTHVTVLRSVEIISKPRDTSICRSVALISFTVAAKHEDSIVWYFNKTRIAAGATLTMRNLTPAHSGYYTCVAYGYCGSVIDSVRLFISDALFAPRGNVRQKDSIELCFGDNLELTYAAENVFYNRWRHNGVLLPAKRDTVYAKQNIDLHDQGWYVSELYNGCNMVKDSVYMSIATMPSAILSVKPADTAFCGVAGNATVTFTFSGQDYEASSIRWYHNGREIPFLRDTFITIKVDDMSKGGMYRYEVISEGTCRKIVTDSVELAINSSMPAFAKRLGSDITICRGYMSELSVSVNEYYRNRWYRNDSLVSEGSNTALQVNRAGQYRMVSYNGCGAISDTINVYVSDPVRIVAPPKNVEVCFDSTLMQPQLIKLAVAAMGDSLRNARWYHGSILVKDVTLSGYTGIVSDTLTIVVGSESEHREGSYRFVVSNHCGEDTATVLVDIRYRVQALTPLANRNAAICEGSSVAFSFAAANATSYSWYKGNAATPLPNADSSLFVIPSLALSDSGVYVVVAGNGCYAVSDTIRLTVNPLPRVINNPDPVVVFDNASIILTGSAAHADRRLWLCNGNPVLNIPKDEVTRNHISGAATDTLTIWYANSLKHTGSYLYVVSNGCGTDTSGAASVAVRDTSAIRLTVQKTACNLDGSPLTAGVPVDSMLMFRILVTGSNLRFVAGVQITDVIPDGFELSLDGLTGKATGDRTISYTVTDALFPNEFELLEYRVKAVKIGQHTNSVDVSYLNAATGARYNISATATVAVISEKDLKVKMETVNVSTDAEGIKRRAVQGDTAISIGNYITYRVTVSNVGRGACSNIMLTAMWSSGVEFVKVVCSPVVGLQRANGVAFAVGSIAADSMLEFEVMVRMKEEGLRLLTASVTVGDDEADTINNRTTLKIRVYGLTIYATTITPNGDGYNDNFEIPFAISYPDNQLTVFNSTGNMVYTKKSYYNEFSGKGLPNGTYYYIFIYRDEEGKQRRLYGPLWITNLY
jgi:uncharacterized repeat protein (TIGR01451 family)